MNDIIWPDHLEAPAVNFWVELQGQLAKDPLWCADLAEAKNLLRWTLAKIKREREL